MQKSEKVKIAICDNDKIICNDIANLIHRQKPDAEIFIFNSAEDFLKAKDEFAILFFDVKGFGGMDAARILRRREEISGKPKSILIFVTGYREYMEEAFEVRAFRYLLKPIDTKKFSEVLDRAFRESKTVESRAENFLLIKVGDIKKKIPLQNIFFIESRNKKVVVHTSEGNFETYGKMDALEIALGDFFYRCHRCYLVNPEKILAYGSDMIYLTNGEKIFLSRKKYSDFVKFFMRYAQKGGIINV